MKKSKRLVLLLFITVFVIFSYQRIFNKHGIKSLFGVGLSTKKVDDFIENQMLSLNIPSLSIAIINDGEVVFHRVKGYSNKEQKVLSDKNSIFEGASISKPVFGFFVMTLVEDGIIELDKPLYEYLPNPDIEYDERYKKITARMVLSHRSGFPNWRDDYPQKNLFIQFEPGTDYHYSGEGYQYLAEVLKHLLKTNWSGLELEFQKRVSIPFKMKHTRFIKDDYIKIHKVQPYDDDGYWIDKNKSEWWKSRDTVFVAPTTLHSESLDFSKWMISMINGDGLSEDGFNELFKPHSLINDGLLKEEYTLGFAKVSIKGIGELYSHSGNNDGFSSYFTFDRERKWGFVFFTNSESGNQLAYNLIYDLLLVGTSSNKILITILVLIIIVSFIYVTKSFYHSQKRVK